MSANSASASPSQERIDELEGVDQSIAALLHFAGLSLAALHPAPLTDFTSRELSLDGGDSDEESSTASPSDPNDRQAQFSNASEAYYQTLNEVQLGLRTSIRHLRLAKASPAPLLDPAFGSGGAAKLGLGGLALAGKLEQLKDQQPRIGHSEPSCLLSTRGMSLEAEGWADLEAALAKSPSRQAEPKAQVEGAQPSSGQ